MFQSGKEFLDFSLNCLDVLLYKLKGHMSCRLSIEALSNPGNSNTYFQLRCLLQYKLINNVLSFALVFFLIFFLD